MARLGPVPAGSIFILLTSLPRTLMLPLMKGRQEVNSHSIFTLSARGRAQGQLRRTRHAYLGTSPSKL